jgi:hypothetical protein
MPTWAEMMAKEIRRDLDIKDYQTADFSLHIPSEHQEGGDHYKRFAIQPIDFIVKNGLGWHEGNILKYICRWKFKDGIGDLKKARDYLDKLIELEEAKE